MISKSKHMQDPIWLREVTNNIIKVTLRRNFVEEPVGEFTFDESDVLIPLRDNLETYITNNFNELFELGLTQMEQQKLTEIKINETNQLIKNGNLSDEIKLLGQQITNVMLGV